MRRIKSKDHGEAADRFYRCLDRVHVERQASCNMVGSGVAAYPDKMLSDS